jgi:hypothetical protein
MAVGAVDQLKPLLEAIGVGPVTGLIIVLAVSIAIAVIRALHTLSVGSHTRRKEFMEIYEKLCAGKADALAWETAIRHYFGIWIPAKAIERIRNSPSPSRRLLALDGRLVFLDFNETDGTFTVKAWCADGSRRKTQIFLLFGLYVFFIFVASVMLGLFGGVEEVPIIVRIALALLFGACGLLSLDHATELKKLSDIVGQYPDLFGDVTTYSTADAATARLLSVPSKPGTMMRLFQWLSARLSGLRTHVRLLIKSIAPGRVNRANSAAITPRE